MTFHLVDAVLFLNIRVSSLILFFMCCILLLQHLSYVFVLHRLKKKKNEHGIFLLILVLCHRQALLSAVAKRIRGFIKLRMALRTLHGALPDATSEEIQAYDDECAICRVLIKLLFILSCVKFFLMSRSSNIFTYWLTSGANGQG